jgi:hypothetical protein
MIDAKMVTTALDLPGYRVVRSLGVVRGIVVRSRSIVGNIGATLQTLLGGNITIYTELCEKAAPTRTVLWSSMPTSLAPTELLVCVMMPTKLLLVSLKF